MMILLREREIGAIGDRYPVVTTPTSTHTSYLVQANTTVSSLPRLDEHTVIFI